MHSPLQYWLLCGMHPVSYTHLKDRNRIIFGLPWTFTKYSLSEDRLFISTGLLSTKEDEVRLYRIMDLSLERKLWQRLFGLGTIKCCSADKTLGAVSYTHLT